MRGTTCSKCYDILHVQYVCTLYACCVDLLLLLLLLCTVYCVCCLIMSCYMLLMCNFFTVLSVAPCVAAHPQFHCWLCNEVAEVWYCWQILNTKIVQNTQGCFYVIAVISVCNTSQHVICAMPSSINISSHDYQL